MRLQLKDLTAQLIIRVATGRYTFVSRWNDGEWLSVLGKRGRNIDGAQFEKARLMLQKVLTMKHRPNHLICAGPTNYKRRYRKIDKWLESKAPHRLTEQWYDSFWTKRIVETGRLGKFLDILRRRRCVLVGPDHLLDVADHLHAPHIECHPSEAMAEVDELYQAIKGSGAEVALLCCGWASNVLAARFSLGHEVKMALDIGSMFDPLAGVASRGCWRKFLKQGLVEPIHAS
jgi:hypothetical protein